MARSFNGTSDYLEHGAAVVGAVPITMACWFNAATLGFAATRTLIAIGDAAADTKVQLILLASGPLQANTNNTSAGAASAQSAVNPKAGMWNHGAGVFASSSDRRVFLNGTKNSNTTTIVLGTPTVSSIGARYVAGVRGGFINGLIAEAAIWNVALEDWEVNLLSRGYYPDQIRPGSLVSYWPLVGQYSPNEIDRKGRFDSVVNGAKPVIANHPPMIPRTRRQRALDFAWLLPAVTAVDMVPARRQHINRAATR